MKFIHIVSIIVLVGGLHATLILNVRFAKLGLPAVSGALMEQGKFLATRIFMPSALVALITGIGMVQMAHYGFMKLWIQYGIIGWVIAVVVGNLVIGRNAAKLSQQLAAGTIDQAGTIAARKKILAFAGFNLLLLFSIVFVMVFKP